MTCCEYLQRSPHYQERFFYYYSPSLQEFVQEGNSEGKSKNTSKAAHQKHQPPHKASSSIRNHSANKAGDTLRFLLLDTAQMVLKESDKTCHCLPNYPFLAIPLKPCIFNTKK
ncbi:hypothetical protein RLOC_00011831 [Lonchura striata]|uniref:Uncharacterized protein n=1 Tax=Lonchura striata TaxID=40157 RepID=A0A218V3U5_9PASE|nr:hypothetical protein RLOC_00011831 [Lonchura striata domestica]